MVAQAAQLPLKTGKPPARGRVLDDSQLADVFGIEIDSAEPLPAANEKVLAKAESGHRQPVPPPVVARKTPAREASTAAAVTKKNAQTVEPGYGSLMAQATASAGKRAARQVAPSTTAQTRKKKAPT